MEQNIWKIQFTLTPEPVQFRYETAGKTVWEAVVKDGNLHLSTLFTTHDTPLPLIAKAGAGDEITFVYRPYRIELYVNSILMDEEWPFGNHYLSNAQRTAGNAQLCTSPVEDAPEEPAFLTSFENAEGWRPGNGVYVGDCMPYTHDGRYHLLYLKDRHRHTSKWGKGAHQWAHISTVDFRHWDVHPMAVEIDDPMEGSICTGSHIFEQGKHYLYYTVRTSDGTPAPIQRSISEDGYHYRKDKTFRFTLSDRYDGPSARDPKIVRDADGLLHMFVTTTDLALQKGVLAHLTSSDNDIWTEIGNLYVRPDGHQPECPDYFQVDDLYYLIRDGHYVYSKQPFSDWIRPEDDLIPSGRVPKSAVWNGRIIFAGFATDGPYAGTLTFLEARRGKDNLLEFFPLEH